MAAVPAALKPIKNILLRANELDRAPASVENADLVAYCCRRYAFQKCMSEPSMKAEEAYLVGLIERLEKDKPSLQEKYGDIMKNKGQQLQMVQAFGTKAFKTASDVYQAGKADKKTAKGFYAAAAFLEVVGDDNEEAAKLKKVAKFNAMSIMKAIKEGREPLPPQVEKEEEESVGGGDPGIDATTYGFDMSLPAAPADLPGLPFAPADVPGLPDVPENEAEDYVRPPNPNLPTGAYARDISTFEDIKPPMFGNLPTNAGLSLRGIQLLKKNSLLTGNFGRNKDKATKQAEDLTRKAVSLLKEGKIMEGIDYVARALEALEGRKPYANVSPSGLSVTGKADMVEYLLFAARTLECAGDLMSLQDGKKRAVDLLSNALQVAQRG